MKKIITIFLIITVLLLSLTGCYDAVSLEDYYYAIAVSIDSSENSNILLSIQIAISNPSNNSTGQSTQNKIYSVDCDNINIGINIINNYLSKKINFSHCSAIIFSEEIAKAGIKNYINELKSNTEIRPNSHILICNLKGTDILESISKSGENFSSRYYDFLINTVESSGYSSQSEFGNFFFDINNNKPSTANYISVEDSTVQAIGIAVFKDDKFDYYLTPYESLAHLIVNNKLKESVISIPDPNTSNTNIDISIEKGIKNNKTDLKIIEGKPFIITNIYVNGKIENIPENLEINALERNLNEYLKMLIDNYYNTILKIRNSDICNYHEKLSKYYFTLNSYNKVNWDELYQNCSYIVTVNSKVTNGLFKNK